MILTDRFTTELSTVWNRLLESLTVEEQTQHKVHILKLFNRFMIEPEFLPDAGIISTELLEKAEKINEFQTLL